ncbi:oligosaccharide flippase family protein [Elusimicrobiota bacterium]
MKKHNKRLLFLGSVYSFGNAAQNILTIILLPLYTSYLYPKDFGIVALMNLTVVLIAKLFSPINQAFNRYYFKPDYQDKSGALLFNLFSLLVLKTIIVTAVFWFAGQRICNVLFGNQEILYIVRLYTVVLLLMPASLFLRQFIRLKEMAKYYVFISLISLIISSVVIIYSLVVLKTGVAALVYGKICGLLFIVIMTVPIILKNSFFKVSLKVIKEPLKYGYPQIVAGYSNRLIQSGDRYVLRMLDTIETVGLYSFGYRIAGLVQMLLVDPLRRALRPIVLKKEGDPEEQKKFLMHAATYYYFAGFLMALGISLFARELIMLLARKEEFWASWKIVPIIVFSYIQHGFGQFIRWGLVMKNKSFHISGILIVAAVVNIGLNFLFIPLWGILGAAFATMISYIIWNLLSMYYSNKFYGLKFQNLRIIHITVIGVLIYMAAVLLPEDKLIISVLIKFVMFLSFPVLMYITGFFSKSERDELKGYYRKMKVVGILPFINEKIRAIRGV